MPDLKGLAELTLSDGRKVVVRMDFEAMALVEDAVAPKSIQDVFAELKDGTARMRTQRALFYGMLKQDMPELTIEGAGDLLLKEAKAFEKGMKALKRTMPEAPAPDAEAGADAEPDPPTAAAEAST